MNQSKKFEIIKLLNDLTKDDLTDMLLERTKEIKDLKIQIEQNKDKVEVYYHVMDCEKLFDLSQTAKILNYPNFGRNKLKSWMRQANYLIGNDTPHSYMINQGYMTTRMKYLDSIDTTIPVPFVYPRGVEFLKRKLDKYFESKSGVEFEHNNK
jgi:anti-repressor protein